MTKKQATQLDIEVGNRIRILRQSKRLSQSKLGEHIGVTFQQVQKYEKGINRIGAGRMNEIAKFLGVETVDLYPEDQRAKRHGLLSDNPDFLRLLVSELRRLADSIEKRGGF